MKKVLAIASGGGHWKQLILLSPAFKEANVKYVTTIDGLPQANDISNYEIVKDSNKNKKILLALTLIQILWIFIKFRPNVVVTTGAAPGLFGLLIGKIFFKKTIWIDSIANAEELSLSGKLSKKFADIVLTQWKHLETDKVTYKGSVF